MANPKSKILPGVLSAFVVVALFHCVDAFAPMLQFDLNIFGTNILGAVAGIITVFLVCIAKKKSFVSIGLNLNVFNILSGLVSSLFTSAVPLMIVAAIRVIVFKHKFIVLPNSPEGFDFMNAVVFAGSCVATAFFGELFFRGFVIRSMRPVYPFFDANIVQTVLSNSLLLLLVVRNIVYGHYDFVGGISKVIFISISVLFLIVYDGVGSIKRGLMARVSGDIWPSFFDNFFFLFLGSIMLTQSAIIQSYSAMVCLLFAQFVSFAFALGYYYRQKNRNKKRKENHLLELKKQREERLGKEVENPDLEDITDKSVKEIMKEYNDQMVSSVGAHSKGHNPEKDENIADLNEVKKE